MPSLHLRRDTLEQSFWLGGTGAQGARQRGGWLAISRRDDRIHAVRKGEVRPDTFPHRAFLCLHLLRRDAGSSLRHGGDVGEFFRRLRRSLAPLGRVLARPSDQATKQHPALAFFALSHHCFPAARRYRWSILGTDQQDGGERQARHASKQEQQEPGRFHVVESNRSGSLTRSAAQLAGKGIRGFRTQPISSHQASLEFPLHWCTVLCVSRAAMQGCPGRAVPSV